MVFRRFGLKSAFIFFLFILSSNSVQAYCLQSFNGYGPIYAPSISHRTQLFMKQILDDNCEVVHLQEIWNTSQIQSIEDLVDLSYISYSPNRHIKNGLMSLSRWNVSQTEYHKFKFNSNGGQFDGLRGLVGVEKGYAVQWLETPIGKMAFINLHLHPTSVAVRLAQIVDLIQWRMKNGSAPIVLTGDFNMTPESLEKSLLVLGLKVQDAVDTFKGGYKKGHCTYCASNRLAWLKDDRVFDYFFYAAPIQITNVEINLKGNSDQPFSDHYGIKVSWNFQKSKVLKKSTLDFLALKQILNESMKKVSFQYSFESAIYQTFKSWNDQMEASSGSFWAYMHHDSTSEDENRVALDSSLALEYQ